MIVIVFTLYSNVVLQASCTLLLFSFPVKLVSCPGMNAYTVGFSVIPTVAQYPGYWATVGITLKPTVYAFIPGQLTSFTGKLNSNKVQLAWSTTFEYNVKTITIMRSQDNKTWKEVVTLQGNGNSSIQKQ